MKLNNSINKQQINPNFGMALNISKKAKPFIEALTSEERQYIKAVGNRIKDSLNDINIDEFGKISLTYRPKASEIVMISGEDIKAVEKAAKIKNKKLRSEVTVGEKVDALLECVQTYLKILMIKMSFGKSKFMKKFQVKEEMQKVMDKSDILREKLKARISAKESIAKKEAESLISEFEPKNGIK